MLWWPIIEIIFLEILSPLFVITGEWIIHIITLGKKTPRREVLEAAKEDKMNFLIIGSFWIGFLFCFLFIGYILGS